jgi:hypothetical protein
MENQVAGRLSSAKSQSCTHGKRSEALVIKLARFYSVVGSRPDEPGALALMAEILAQSANDDQIDGALTRCARECRYPIRLPDILQRVEGQEIPQLEAEGRKAWETVCAFAEKWVQSDVEGNYVIDRGVRSSEPPQVAQRILDTVRRVGGWRILKCMTHGDYPFVQKRFLEEYAAWTAVEQVPATKLLAEMPRLELVAKPMINPPQPEAPAVGAELAATTKFKPKPIPVPVSDAQLRDRREMLKQQTESLAAAKRSAPPASLAEG